MSSLQYLSLFLDAASRSRVRGNVSHRPEFALARSHESPRVTGLLSFRGDVHFLLVHRRIARSRGERQEGSARISSYPRARARSLSFVFVCDCVLTVPEEETTNRRRENEVSSFVSLFCSCLSVLLLLLLLFLLSIGSNIDIDALLRRLRVFRAR